MIKASTKQNKDGTWTGYVEVWHDEDKFKIYSYSTRILRLTQADAVKDALIDKSFLEAGGCFTAEAS